MADLAVRSLPAGECPHPESAEARSPVGMVAVGVGVLRAPHAWAWILHPEPAAPHIGLSVLVFVTGAACWAGRRPRS